jgi:site-specific recombinase XerD
MATLYLRVSPIILDENKIDLRALRTFRASWPNQNLGALKKLEYLRAFFRFADESKWIDENPARQLDSPKVKQRQTMPYTVEEMARILIACEKYGNRSRGGKYRPLENTRRIRAFVLVLRYGGLRIGDGVALKRTRITDGKLFLYTAKTETPVYCPPPEFVVTALEAVPKVSETYFFGRANQSLRAQQGIGSGP